MPSPTVAHCASPYLEMTNVWIYDQIRSLSRYRPVVLTQAVRNRDHYPSTDVVFTHEALPAFRRMAYRGLRKWKGTYVGYQQVLIQEGVDLMHAHFGQEGFRCLGARRRARIPMVTSFYGLDVSVLPKQRIWFNRFQRLFAEGQLFLAEGPRMAESIEALGCPHEKIETQCLGVDLERITLRAGDDRSEAGPIVMTYASFREKKGLVYGLRAVHRVLDRYPGLRVRMVGDGPLRPEIETEIEALGMGDRVDLLGVQPHAVCLEELHRATVLLHPSVTAGDGDTEGGAPVALIEAMASGLPVVSSLHADIPTIVPHEKCGLLFRERDVEGLADGLDAILGSEELRAEMGRAGRAHVEANHDRRVLGGRLEGIYDRVVGGKI